MYDGVSGVDSSNAATASTPCSVGFMGVCNMSREYPLRRKLSHQNSVPSTRSSASLCMSERSYTRIEAKSVSKHVFDVFCSYGFQFRIMSAFGYDYNCFAFAYFTVLGPLSQTNG